MDKASVVGKPRYISHAYRLNGGRLELISRAPPPPQVASKHPWTRTTPKDQLRHTNHFPAFCVGGLWFPLCQHRGLCSFLLPTCMPIRRLFFVRSDQPCRTKTFSAWTTWRLNSPRTPKSSSQASMLTARAPTAALLPLTDSCRDSPWQADLQEEVPLGRQRWLRLLQRRFRLGYA